MTDSTARSERQPATYEASTASHERCMEAARLAIASGDAAGAEQALTAAIEAAERDPSGAAGLATALAQMGELEHQRGNESRAEQLYQRALELRERLLGPEHPDLVVLINDLSRLYLKRSAHQAAEPLLLRLVAIKRIKGEEHPEVATVLASLASVRQALGQYESAEQLWRRVLAIRERTLAPNHFALATALEHLAETCAARGKLNEALRLMQRALATRELTLGRGHASLRTARERIADLQLHASEEALDSEMPDTSGPADVAWLPPAVLVPQSPPVSPIAFEPRPVAPPIIEPRPSIREPEHLPPARQAPAAMPAPASAAAAPGYAQPLAPPPSPVFAEPPAAGLTEELRGDGVMRREGPDATGLRLVSVATPGEAPRSLIMPYLSDVAALAEEDLEDTGSAHRAGAAAGVLAVLQRRQGAIAITVGATALVLGALGVRSMSGRTADETALPAPRQASLPAPSPASDIGAAPVVAERVTAAGAVVPDRPLPVNASESEPASETVRASEPARRVASAAPSDAPAATLPAVGLPRALDIRVDAAASRASADLVGTDAGLAPSVTLPTASRLRSAAASAEGSQPAMLIVAPSPVYPAELWGKGVRGQAAVEFTVDTTGRAVLSTFKSQSNDKAFTEAVRAIVPDMRFVPATSDGRKVRTVVRMRFDFSKSGVTSGGAE